VGSPQIVDVSQVESPNGIFRALAESPNYWAYAHNFVLQDHMFESNVGWSLPRTTTSSQAGPRGAARCLP
jgi:hypothetical protein